MSKKVPLHINKLLEDLKGELWKEIPFKDGYFMVSNYGGVKALERLIVTEAAPNGCWLKPKILSQSINKMRSLQRRLYATVVSYIYV